MVEWKNVSCDDERLGVIAMYFTSKTWYGLLCGSKDTQSERY